MVGCVLTPMSPGGKRGRLSILIYHRVLREPDPLFPELPDAVRFEKQMYWIREWFNVLPLAEAVERLNRRALPARSLAITFDDGYADNEDVAAPILLRQGLHATFFVATGFLNGKNMWNDRVIESVRGCPAREVDLSAFGGGRVVLVTDAQRRDAIDRVLRMIKHFPPAQRQVAVERIEAMCAAPPSNGLMMKPVQVARLAAAGFDIGGHTVSHPILARLPADEAKAEIAAGKSDLEAIIGRRVTLFAYPNGVPGQDYLAQHVQMVRECGFSAAVSTAWGAATYGADIYQLPRFTPWDRTHLRFILRLVQNLSRGNPSVAS
jgi:peptidoglycan/xylan/chitin deacetylase (PgdA/CDA1 family)